ncbi:MAG: sigma-54-dependent Fis family transcriptional regulator [Acidobacteria bacterium]|nr:sigma-54-dependent Fis family transcriptional regulator [Acidobacteriota bacterium]
MSDPRQPVLLVVDDEPANLQKLKRTFVAEYRVLEAASGEEAFAIAEREDVDLVITDQKMPRMSGIELLKRILRIKPDVMRIVLTGYTEVEDLIHAINDGHVYRYITKPWDPVELRIVVRQALEKQALERENRRLTEALRQANERLSRENQALQGDVRRFLDAENIVFRSRAMAEILDSARRVAGVDTTVLLTGETGTGKELVARFIHRHSRRAGEVFVAVNCGAIPRELAESEFFGYRKGAFSGAVGHKKGYFQVADGGTLFLDEVGEAPAELQVKLLRALQQGEIWPVGAEKPARVDVRVVASTNRDLQAEVRAGAFREDLFFRLNVFTVRIPPLAERRDDIRPLVAFFLERAQAKMNRRPVDLSEEALRLLEAYRWPGNVRQLENEVERLVLLSTEGGTIEPDAVAAYIRDEVGHPPAGAPGAGGGDAADPAMDLRRQTDAFERGLIIAALDACGGNRTHAAARLHITRQSLLEKMKRFGVR